MNKVMLLMLAATLTACGPSHPSETVDALVANPDSIDRHTERQTQRAHGIHRKPQIMQTERRRFSYQQDKIRFAHRSDGLASRPWRSIENRRKIRVDSSFEGMHQG